MSENKHKKKKRRRKNKSPKQKKTEVVSHKEDESKDRRFPESTDRRSCLSDCYQMVVSRITNAFARIDRDSTHAETNSKVGCETEKELQETGFPSTEPAGRLSRKDIFEYHKEIPSRNLFEAIEKLCNPRLSPYIEAKIPMMKCFNHHVDHYGTSVLIEIFNNEPKIAMDNPMMSELLHHIISSGKISDMNLKTTQKKQNRRYSHKKTNVSNDSDCTISPDIFHITRFPEFLRHPPCSLCRFFKNSAKKNNKYEWQRG